MAYLKTLFILSIIGFLVGCTKMDSAYRHGILFNNSNEYLGKQRSTAAIVCVISAIIGAICYYIGHVKYGWR